MQTLMLIALLITFGLAFRAKAAGPTTNPVELEEAAAAKLSAHPDPVEDDDVATRPLDASVRKYLNDRAEAANLLREAAALPTATWPAIGDNFELKSLNGPRWATNFLRLRARQNAADGRPAEAVGDLLAAMAVGRHVGQQNLQINQLVAIGCEGSAIDGLAALLPKLPADVVRTLPAKLAALPAAMPLARVIDGERAFGTAMVHKQIGPVVTQPAVMAGGQQLAMRAWEAAAPLYDAAKANADASPDDYAKAIDRAAAKLLANPYAQAYAPALRAFRSVTAVIEAKRAMLNVAIAVRLAGEQAVNHSVDPFGSGPFEYEKTPGGFRLTSALKVVRDGVPVALTVGEETAR